MLGKFDFARSFLERAEAIGRSGSDPDPVFASRLQFGRGYLELVSGQLAKGIVSLSRARTLAHRTGDGWTRVMASTFCAYAFSLVGACERAEAAAREVMLFSEAAYWIDHSALFVAVGKVTTHGARGGTEAVASLRALLDRPNVLLAASARALLAAALVTIGDLDGAEREATTVLEHGLLFHRAQALEVLALVALHRGHPTAALALAARALDTATSGVSPPEIEAALHLARAEALHALGQTPDAHAAIREARDRILRIAATLDELELRESYVTNVDANARTLKLAREWLGEEATTT
jgi:tetratricopeptide (TPR) repeat protein